MLNVDSPIIQSLGSMPNQGVLPNLNMGNNIISIGNNGYNQQNLGGYYNNNYYYNPYLFQQQEMLRIAQQKEEARKQSDVWKLVSRKVNTILGNEIDEEKLKELYDPKFAEEYDDDAIDTPIKVKIIDSEGNETKFKEVGKGKVVPIHLQSLRSNTLMDLHLNWTGINPQVNNMINRMNQIYDESKRRFPDDISLYEFLKNAGELYVEGMIERDRKNRKDKTQVYSATDYSKLLNAHSHNSFFPEVFGSQRPDLGDMEITLPSHLKNERDQRRQMFLDAIITRGR